MSQQNASLQDEFFAKQQTILKGYQDGILSLQNDRQALVRFMLESQKGLAVTGAGIITNDCPIGYTMTDVTGTWLANEGTPPFTVRMLDLQNAKKLQLSYFLLGTVSLWTGLLIAFSTDTTPLPIRRFAMAGTPRLSGFQTAGPASISLGTSMPVITDASALAQDPVSGAFSGTLSSDLSTVAGTITPDTVSTEIALSMDAELPCAGSRYAQLIFVSEGSDGFGASAIPPITYQLFA